MIRLLTNLGEVAGLIKSRRKAVPMKRSLLIGISGIDASGKGYAAGRLSELLRGFKVAVIMWTNG